jgi:hypothetical protein
MIKTDLEEDIAKSPELLQKLKHQPYAQNLYAAFCNQEWQKRELFPILGDDIWSVSWRRAGGIIASLRNEGEHYMDYYCSGILDDADLLLQGYVVEGQVTDEIKDDLHKINWYLIEEEEDNNENV